MSIEVRARPARQETAPQGRSLRALKAVGGGLLQLLWRKRRVMLASTMVELKKRYSGSLLGPLWIFLQPLLFFGIYIFVYLLIFKVAAPGKSSLEYVLYVFCGLVPFLAFMEVFSASCIAIKQNVGIIRNVILPVEFLPVRTVCIAMVPEAAGLAIILLLASVGGTASWHLLWLPVVIALQMLMLIGIAMIMSSLGVAIPDLMHVSGIISLALMQVSPIAYTLDMVPAGLLPFVTYANPLTPMMEMFRACIVEGRWPDPGLAAFYAGSAIFVFMLGVAGFARFKGTVDDHV